MLTEEFLMWGNCTNKCKFCHQCLKKDPETHLSESEMQNSINITINKVQSIENQEDVLLVGGEILNVYYNSLISSMNSLFDTCIKKLLDNKIRYLYINTNLLYKDLTLLDSILQKIVTNKLENRLKFTTSYDLYGRFENNEIKTLFFNNLHYIHNKYPKINVVVNIILTKQAIEKIVSKEFDILEFKNKYNIVYINFIPYIPINSDSSMTAEFKDYIKCFAVLENIFPGYIKTYINDFDFNQNKVLYEYKSGKGYVECTSEYAECHHNVNFKKVLGNNECYICKLIESFC